MTKKLKSSACVVVVFIVVIVSVAWQSGALTTAVPVEAAGTRGGATSSDSGSRNAALGVEITASSTALPASTDPGISQVRDIGADARSAGSRESSNDQVVVDVNGCAAVLVAPTFVLTSASCLVQASSTARVDHIFASGGRGNTSVEIRVLTQKAVIHPLFFSSGRRPEFDFAILELAEKASNSAVVLSYTEEGSWQDTLKDLHEDLVIYSSYPQQQHVRDARRQSYQLPASSVFGREETCNPANATVVCAQVKKSCQDLAEIAYSTNATNPSVSFLGFSDTAAGEAADTGRAHILGMYPMLPPCRDETDTKEGLPSSTNLFVPVAAARSFIDKHSVGHNWQQLEPTDDASSSSNGGENSESPPTINPLTPYWHKMVPQLGYLVGDNATVHEDKFVPFVLIAPRFGLSRVKWFRESTLVIDPDSANQTVRAVVDGESILLKRLIFETAAHSDLLRNRNGILTEKEEQRIDWDYDLVVFELENEASTPAILILSPTPQLNVVLPDAKVLVLDMAVEHEDKRTSGGALESALLSDCGDQALSNGSNGSMEFLCAHVPVLTHQTPPSSVNQAVLATKNALIGFASSNQRGNGNISADERYTRFSFSRLAFEHHAAFLTIATESTIAWTNDDESLESPEDAPAGSFPSFIASFFSEAQRGPLRCQGMLIAPKAVLTTASCALGNAIVEAVFVLPDRKLIHVPILPDQTIVHPRFNTTSSLSQDLDAGQYDFAILQLQFPTIMAPAMLSIGGLSDTDDPVGFHFIPKSTSYENGRIGAENLFTQTAFNRSTKCSAAKTAANSSSSSLLVRQSTSFCLTPCQTTTPEDDNSITFPPKGKTSSKEVPPLFPPSDGDDEVPPVDPRPSFMGSAFGKQLNNTYSLVGFGVTHEVDDGDIYSVSSLADAAVFINAYVAGTSWEAGGVLVDGPLQLSKRYIVGLRVSKYGQNFCGGSLIAPSYVLTAAHCVTDGLAKYVSIGSKASSGEETEAIGVVQESIVVHQSYGTPYKFSYDAAILELKASAYATPVVLDRSPDFSSGEEARMYGYGATIHGSSTSESTLSPEIRAVDLSLLSQAQCKATLPDIDKSMLCAVGKNGDDACKGDSGGPLVVLPKSVNSNGDVLVGVVSSGYECGLKDVPGIYMRVSSLSSFIEDHTVGAEWGRPVTQLPTPSSTLTPTVTPSTDAEMRDLDNLSPRESASVDGSNATSRSDELGSVSEHRSPIQYVDVPTDLKPQVRHALLTYLLGISESLVVSSAFLAKLTSGTNWIRFYSSGDLSPILETLKHHNSKPLYARKDRFGRYKSDASTLDGNASSSLNQCKS